MCNEPMKVQYLFFKLLKKNNATEEYVMVRLFTTINTYFFSKSCFCFVWASSVEKIIIILTNNTRTEFDDDRLDV